MKAQKKSFLESVWYERLNLKNFYVILPLLPLSLLFGFITAIRRFFYRKGLFKSYKSKLPLIVIGGINVGGTGKTPLCIALINRLSQSGFKVGLVSRGYKGEADNYPYIVTEGSKTKESGDEPYLIKLSVKDKAIVVVDPNRERGVAYLEKLGCDLILCDDGLQHYSLARDLEIIVIDGKRQLGNGFLMPAGPLREGKWHLNKADFVIVNGKTNNQDFYEMHLAPSKAISISSFTLDDNHEFLDKGAKVIAMAGIGNPMRFYNTVEAMGYTIVDTIEVGDHKLVDEHTLKEKSKNFPIVMTSKDAVKYAHLKLEDLFVINVEADFSDSFYQKLLNKIKEIKK